jgi:hypothetical protein
VLTKKEYTCNFVYGTKREKQKEADMADTNICKVTQQIYPDATNPNLEYTTRAFGLINDTNNPNRILTFRTTMGSVSMVPLELKHDGITPYIHIRGKAAVCGSVVMSESPDVYTKYNPNAQGTGDVEYDAKVV